MVWRLFWTRDKSSTRCSQRRLAEPGSALYGASGMVRGKKRRRMRSQLQSQARLGPGVGRSKVVEKGMAVLHRSMQKVCASRKATSCMAMRSKGAPAR